MYRPESHSESVTVLNVYRPESRSESGLPRGRPSLESMPGLRWELVTEPSVYRRESRSESGLHQEIPICPASLE